MAGPYSPMYAASLFRGRRRPNAVVAPAASDPAADRRTARELCQAIDDAMTDGRLERADRFAATAARLVPTHPRVAERLARLRLAQARPQDALVIVDSCAHGSASLRLLRAVCLLQSGEHAEAHIDLHRWSRWATAPLQARLLLAVLDWQLGDTVAAADALRRNLAQLDDPTTLEMLVLLFSAQGDRAEAEAWARRLHRGTSFGARRKETAVLVRSLGLQHAARDAAPTTAQLRTLGMELTGHESVIPALVEAQRLEPEPATIELLVPAIKTALPELAQPGIAMESLSRLELLRGDALAAARWAERAFRVNPMSATASMLLAECADVSAGDPFHALAREQAA